MMSTQAEQQHSHGGPILTIVRATASRTGVTKKIYACCGFFCDADQPCPGGIWNSHTHSGNLVMLRLKKKTKGKPVAKWDCCDTVFLETWNCQWDIDKRIPLEAFDSICPEWKEGQGNRITASSKVASATTPVPKKTAPRAPTTVTDADDQPVSATPPMTAGATKQTTPTTTSTTTATATRAPTTDTTTTNSTPPAATTTTTTTTTTTATKVDRVKATEKNHSSANDLGVPEREYGDNDMEAEDSPIEESESEMDECDEDNDFNYGSVRSDGELARQYVLDALIRR